MPSTLWDASATTSRWLEFPAPLTPQAHRLLQDATHVFARVAPSTLLVQSFVAYTLTPSGTLHIFWIQSFVPHAGLTSSLLADLIRLKKPQGLTTTRFTEQGSLLLEHVLRRLCSQAQIPFGQTDSLP